jgi:hypothetical protein
MPAQNHLGITALFFSCRYIIRATDPISFVNAYADAKDLLFKKGTIQDNV